MNARRKFLVSSAKVGAIGVASVAIAGCSKGKPAQKELTRGKSKKVEVLYQKSKYWEAYYKVAH